MSLANQLARRGGPSLTSNRRPAGPLNAVVQPRRVIALATLAVVSLSVTSVSLASRSLTSIDNPVAALEPAVRVGPPIDVRSNGLTSINEQRVAAGVAPLEPAAALDNSAQIHALDMAAAETAFCDGLSFVGTDGSDTDDRMERYGYSPKDFGESLLCDQTTASEAVARLMQNPAQRELILRPNFVHLGVGLGVSAEGVTYWSFTFGEPSRTT